MKILLCSDGTPSSDKATRLTSMLAPRCQAGITLLGVAEKPSDEQALQLALEKEAQVLRTAGLSVQMIVRAGDPILQVVNLSASNKFNLTIIGARGQGPSGLHLRSNKTYEFIKAVHSPVLVAMGEREELRRFLVCTGGKSFIDEAVRLTGEIAACAGASVTLLHVMAEPPAIYLDLVRLEEDVDRLIESGSELGENLRAQKKALEERGVPVELRIRHGIVLEQIFKQLREGNHDLIVTGSSQSIGPFRHYIMGDITRGILNRADCPVLVARGGETALPRNFWRSLKALFRARSARAGVSQAK
jgi:nucleotide-binding universal stress UspA family protein